MSRGKARYSVCRAGERVPESDNREGREVGSYVAVYPDASKAYDARYGSSVCDRFIIRSDKGGFSGVAVCSCVYSACTARVDTYKDGVKREGVFLLDGTDRSVSDAKVD